MYNWMRFIHEKATTDSEWDLYSCVQSQQAKMKLYEHKHDFILSYKNEQETFYAKEILDLYAKEMMKSYFNGLYYTDNKCYMLNDEEHFMFSLFCFLSGEHGVANWKLKDKVYADREELDPPYYNLILSDFGRAYYKLNYIATKFCEENCYTKDFHRVTTSKHIEEYLNSNKVGFWQIRH